MTTTAVRTFKMGVIAAFMGYLCGSQILYPLVKFANVESYFKGKGFNYPYSKKAVLTEEK